MAILSSTASYRRSREEHTYLIWSHMALDTDKIADYLSMDIGSRWMLLDTCVSPRASHEL